MLLRPSNTLLLDEPTNHLDLDSKDVLLEALEDFGGTLIFVSHDRYFVDKLASKVIEIGDGQALIYPGNYEEWLWSKKQREAETSRDSGPGARGSGSAVSNATADRRSKQTAQRPPNVTASRPEPRTPSSEPRAESPEPRAPSPESRAPSPESYEERKRREAEARKARKAADSLRRRVEELEARIAERESAIKEIEASMSAPGFYENRDAAQPIIDRHQALMWEVGDLMNQWEALQTEL
jgi:ATP-binding cassette subfamily F protein 3